MAHFCQPQKKLMLYVRNFKLSFTSSRRPLGGWSAGAVTLLVVVAHKSSDLVPGQRCCGGRGARS